MNKLKSSLFVLVILFFANACKNEPKKVDHIPTPAQETPTVTPTTTQAVPHNPPQAETEKQKKVLEKDDSKNQTQTATEDSNRKSEVPGKDAFETNPKSEVPSGFADIEKLDKTVALDIRYATANNFTKSKIYDCPRCLLRPEAAEAIVKAHKALQAKGLGLKMFDCFRPRPYQQRLWDKVPNPNYVTPPAKGSMHSRGAAVDLTIVDKNGKELEMGTPYDFFGQEAHFDYTKLPENVLANRRLLRETMETVGFAGIRTEWWHFSFRGKEFPLSSEVWKCF